MRITLPNCELCGRFVSWRNGYASYIPFGSQNDLEPPDEQFMHTSCYEALNPTQQRYYSKWVWRPVVVRQPEAV